MMIAIVTLALAAGAPTPAAKPAESTPLFSRPEPAIAEGADALADGDAARALDAFRKAKGDTPNQRAIVEYDVGQALAALALASAQQAAPPAAAPATAPGAGAPDQAAPPQLDKTKVDDAQAAFSRARGLAHDPRVKAEAALAAGNLAAFAGDVDNAIAQYRQALKDDATNERAKKNLRRTLEAKKQQQQQQQPQDGDKKNDDKKNDDKKNDDKKNDDKKNDDKKNGDQQQQDQQKQQQQDPGSPEAKKAEKKEAARRLLDALRARERPLTPLEMRGAKPVRAKEGKDW